MYSRSRQKTIRYEEKNQENWLQQQPELQTTYIYQMKSKGKGATWERKMRVGSGTKEWDISILEI